MKELSQPKISSVLNGQKQPSKQSIELNSLNFLEEENKFFEKRLIDTDIFYIKGSDIGNAERYNRGKTLHTINVWWARRPLSTMRVLIYASLISEFSEQNIHLFDELSKRIILPESYYKLTQQILRKGKNIPKILDPFGGNGTIAYEASNLGLESYTMDINEYAYFIQTSLLNIGFSFDENDVKRLLKKHGFNILRKLEIETADLFPLRAKNFTNYIWSYQKTCKNCNLPFTISKRKYLSKKKNKAKSNNPIGLNYCYDTKLENFEIIEVINKEKFKESNWKNNSVICPFCKSINSVKFAELEDKLLVGIKLRESFGKDFIKTDSSACPSNEFMINKLQNYVEKYNLQFPNTPVEKWSGIVNPGIYGIETHGDIFNLRQKLVITILISILLDEFKEITTEETKETALFIISLLAGFIDQLVDWNCRLSMWISENEQVGRAFCGPGIPMLWDYSEIDPILKGPANLWDKLDRIINSKRSFVEGSIKPQVKNAKVQDLPFKDDFFDLVITDPPYYDNIFYSVLSNFFYTWKKVLMEKIEPELFSKEITTINGELVSSSFRNIDSKSAHLNYIKDFSKAIKEIERVCKQDGLFGLIYGHSSIEGWLPILESFKQTNFHITSVQPLRIERIHRPRSMKSNASNSVVVIIARKFLMPKSQILMSELFNRIESICNEYIPSLKKDNWSVFEIGIPIFANCIGLLANHSNVIDNDNYNTIIEIDTLIPVIIKHIQNFLPEFNIKRRKSL